MRTCVTQKLIRGGARNLNLGNNTENNIKYERKKIGYLVFLIIFVMFTVTGGTYAYYALSASNNAISGIAATVGLDFKVERILPSSVGGMVPQLEEYLGSAISTNYNCIDDNGNTVCQVYKATLTNTSTATVRVNGTIKFSGIDNMPNLKWKRITDERTIGEYTSKVASTSNVIFENEKVLEKDESEDYYFVIWIDETGESQTDSGTFNVTIEFNPANGGGLTSTITGGEGGGSTTPKPINAYADSYMTNIATSDASLDFSQTSETSNTNGVYLRSGTENDTYPIYYYRGNVNNNLIFADTCWKVVRTTETGGLKLIYNGVPTDGSCDNTGETASIGFNYFNYGIDTLAYVGYMYSNPYTRNSKNLSSETNAYVYGNDVTYSNGTYTLDGTDVELVTVSLSSAYDGELNNNHYTCFSTGTTCESVYYIYYTSSYYVYYITLTNGKKIEDALVDMLGADDNNTENYNTTSSTVKGNNTTEGTLDYWYYTNIYNQGYSSYMEDTVWCNDRSISNLNGWNPDGGDITNYLAFSSYDRVFTNASPSLSCSRNIDKFTVSEANGNGDLDYPVGLLTADEIMLAGADSQWSSNETYYLYSGNTNLVGSPNEYDQYRYAYMLVVSGDDGSLMGDYGGGGGSVRPSVSLKPGFSMTGDGDGTATNPYKISY